MLLHNAADGGQVLSGDDVIWERLLYRLVHLRESKALAADVIKIDRSLRIIRVGLYGAVPLVTLVVKEGRLSRD